MKTVAKIEENEYTDLKRNAAATGQTVQDYKEAEGEVLNVAKVTTDSLKYKEHDLLV